MNKKMTKYIIGKMLGVEAILLLIPMMEIGRAHV